MVDKHSGYWFTVGDGDVIQGVQYLDRLADVALTFIFLSMGRGYHFDGTW